MNRKKVVFMKRNKIIISFAAALLMALSMIVTMPGVYAEDTSGSSSSSSSTIDGLKDDLSNVRNNLDQAKGEYDAAVKELKDLQTKISALETQIEEKQGEIDVTQGQIDENDALLETLRQQIEELDNEITDQNSALNQRLRVMYETDDQSMLSVLLGSDSFVDFLTNLDMVQRIHQSDKDFLEELQGKLDDVESKRDQAVAIEATLTQQRADLQSQKDQLDSDKAALASAQSRVKEIRDNAAAEVKRLEEESNRIQQELSKMTSQWGDYEGGAMAWPVRGPITSPFGMRIHPITGQYIMHTGIDIGVATGTPVHAAADGIVYYAQWNTGGYGNLVMIDNGVDANGNTIVTMYAHNSSFAVSKGSVVKRGDIIAYAGSTGNSTGPHVHFEVRVNGTPVNPMNWLG